MAIKRFSSATATSNPSMRTRLLPIRSVAGLLCGLVALVAGSVGSQDGSDWAEVSSGASDVSGVGAVHYSVGYSNIGYDHFRSEIVVRWRDGTDRTQTLYDGIYDRPPAKVWGIEGHLCVSMEACARYEDACTAQTIAYRYDAAAKSFTELGGGDGLCRR
ncbi:hypothetical protein ACQKGL_26490 [Ensifer adhaerens]|uniref:hypothetical protein n=1 Tax=Ensifer adhaerens TaxID=106592 RepID=UPI003D05CA45